MRRYLTKKMKNGYLTPGERKELVELDREVNQLNRRAGRNFGLGATAALLAAKQSRALDGAGDALSRFLDERSDIRENRKAERANQKELEEMRKWQGDYESERAAKRRSEEREFMRAESKAEREEEKKMKAAESAAEDLLKMARKASADEDFFDEALEADLDKYDASKSSKEPESEAEAEELAVGRAREPYGVQAKRQAERERSLRLN